MQLTHIDYLGNQMSMDNREYLKELNSRFDISDEQLKIDKERVTELMYPIKEASVDSRTDEEKLQSIKTSSLPNVSTEELITLSQNLKQGTDNGN